MVQVHLKKRTETKVIIISGLIVNGSRISEGFGVNFYELWAADVMYTWLSNLLEMN